MELVERVAASTPPLLLALLGGVLTSVASLVAARIILGRCARWFERPGMSAGRVVVESLKIPVWLAAAICGVVSVRFFLTVLEPESKWIQLPFDTIALVLIILAIVAFADRFSVGVLGRYANRTELLRNSTGIVTGITRGMIVGVGALILLGTLGISITPLIASLGITSLAVALALQPTLENFFSGVQLVIDKPIRVGDYIELESGEQGFVDKIGWRSTWIRMLPNNTVIIPNSALSGSKIINYFYPEKELSVPVDVGVHYDSDLEHVERVTLEVAREVLKTHEWGVSDYNTFVVFHSFGESSIDFTVMLRAKEYFNRFWVKSAFIKALHRRYAEENITIPYPIRALNVSQENAAHLRVGPDLDIEANRRRRISA
jgi:small-conductance mechanosensitive channel